MMNAAQPDTTLHQPGVVFSKVHSGNWEVPREEIKLVKKIGNGATGDVYRAYHKGKFVAAKMLKDCGDGLIEQAYEDIVMEVQVLVSLGRHPNVVQLMGVCVENKRRPILLEELVEGPNLEVFLQNPACRGKLQRPTIYKWSTDIWNSLDFLHNRDPCIMHRDVKPGNFMVTADYTALKLADFGMSKLVPKSQMPSVINTGYTGTVRYMAPEVLTQRKGHYTEKADIYSAALVMYYIATEKRPNFLTQNSEEDLRKRPDLSVVQWPSIEAIIEKAWQHKPEARPSASEMIRLLVAIPDKPSENLRDVIPSIGGCCTIS